MDDGNTLRTTVPQFTMNDTDNEALRNSTANPGNVAGINSVEVVTDSSVYVQGGTEVFRGGGTGREDLISGRIDSIPNGGRSRVLVIVSSVMLSACLVFVVILASLLYKYKRRKVLRASSPLLLGVTLLGGSFVYIQCLILLSVSTSHPLVSCIIAQWLYMTGITLMYGSLGLKTWRVSVILLFYKSRQMHTKDRSLLLRLLALVAAVTLYLVIWTFLILHDGQIVRREVDACSYRAWGQIIATLGEVGLLLWASVMCYQARLAPALYNDSSYIGLAVWNHLIWIINSVISRYYLETYHNTFLKLLLLFIFTQCTTTITLCLVFIPKFSAILNRTRILEGTLTDVYGPARVHKLTLVINKTGSVRTINCSPCGPLQDVKDESEYTETSDIRETRETEYSKEEVNALIDLVSKLKNERQHYKSQLKSLITDLTQMKENYGLQSLPWPKTPLLPDTPALHLPEVITEKPASHKTANCTHNQQLNTLTRGAVNVGHPLADSAQQHGSSLRCPVLNITDVAASSSAAVSLGIKPSLVPNGRYYPRSILVGNALGPKASNLDNAGTLNPIDLKRDKTVMRPSRTRDSICTMMTSISLSSPTTNLLNIEETNLSLLETLSPSTGYKTEDAKDQKNPPANSCDEQSNFNTQGISNNNHNGAGGRNSPDSSIAQGYDNKGICEWLSQSEGKTIAINNKHTSHTGLDLCRAERESLVPRITISNASSTLVTASTNAPLVSNPCCTSVPHNDINQTTQTNATNNLNNPPSGENTASLCYRVKDKCPVKNMLSNNITSGPQRPNSLTLAKRATSHDHNGGCYTKRTNYVFYI